MLPYTPAPGPSLATLNAKVAAANASETNAAISASLAAAATNIYTTTAAGLAATAATPNKFFSVIGSNNDFAIAYENVAGDAVERGRYPSKAALDAALALNLAFDDTATPFLNGFVDGDGNVAPVGLTRAAGWQMNGMVVEAGVSDRYQTAEIDAEGNVIFGVEFDGSVNLPASRFTASLVTFLSTSFTLTQATLPGAVLTATQATFPGATFTTTQATVAGLTSTTSSLTQPGLVTTLLSTSDPTYAVAALDVEGNVVEATTHDGTKVLPGATFALGQVTLPGAVLTPTQATLPGAVLTAAQTTLPGLIATATAFTQPGMVSTLLAAPDSVWAVADIDLEGNIIGGRTQAGEWVYPNVKSLAQQAADAAAAVQNVRATDMLYRWPVLQVANRCGPETRGMTDGTTHLNIMTTTWHDVSQQADYTDIVLRFANISASYGSGPNDVPLRVSIEYPAGTIHEVNWANGARDIVLAPGAMADTMPLPITVTAGSKFGIRRWIPLTSGQVCWQSNFFLSADDQTEIGSTDKTGGGTIATTAGSPSNTVFLPIAILGKPSTRTSLVSGDAGRPVIGLAIYGDSISVGRNDNNDAGLYGYIQRALLNKVAWTHLGQTGQALGVANQGGNPVARRHRFGSLAGVTHMLSNMGSNDIGNARTWQQTRDDYIALNADMLRRGIRLIPMTVMPRTNSTNTAAAGGFYTANIKPLNDWMLTNPFGWGVIDIASVVRDPANYDLWRPEIVIPTSFDGVHPPAGLHAYAATYLAANLPALLV